MKLQQTLKTGKGKSSHYHFAYFDDVQGGITSISNDHIHVITVEPLSYPIIDPSSGITLTEGTQGGPTVQPGGKDSHTHLLEEITLTEPQVKKSDDELVRENKELYRVGVDIEKEAFKLAEASEEFFMGKQWDDADKAQLRAKSRAALTINECESKIDLLSGYQRQNRSDFKFMPTEGGDGRVADILNVVVKNICDQNDWEFQETDVFEDGTITGRGNIHAYVDHTENVMGDIKLEHFPWRDVKYGPHNKKDGADCEFIVKAKWYSKDKLTGMFPDKKDSLEVDWEGYSNMGSASEQMQPGADYPAVGTEVARMNLDLKDITSFISITKKEYLLIETERKEYQVVPVVFSLLDNFFMNLLGLKKSHVKAITTIPGLESLDQVVTKIRRVTTAGTVLLKDDYLTDPDFSLIPFYAKKRGNMYWGKIEGIKDLQMEINKRHSQAIDIVNKMASYGWFYDSDTFDKKEDEEAFTQFSSQPGFRLKIADISKPPVMTQGVKFPVELSQMMQLDSQKIKEMMNINLEMAGMARSSQSGVAIIEQKRQGLVGNEFLFDNLNASKKRLGRKIVRMIAKTYTPERLMRLLNTQAMVAPGTVKIQGTELEKYPREELAALLATDDLLSYDVVVTESSFNPTNRLANFMIWSDLAGKGAPIPIMSLVDMSDAPDKDKMKKDIQAEMDRKAQELNAKNQTEIQKTQIAHGQQDGTQPQDKLGMPPIGATAGLK